MVAPAQALGPIHWDSRRMCLLMAMAHLIIWRYSSTCFNGSYKISDLVSIIIFFKKHQSTRAHTRTYHTHIWSSVATSPLPPLVTIGCLVWGRRRKLLPEKALCPATPWVFGGKRCFDGWCWINHQTKAEEAFGIYS